MISYFIFIFSKLIDVANLRIYSVSGKIRSNSFKDSKSMIQIFEYNTTREGERRVKVMIMGVVIQ
jgi:hypothetical protein